MAAALLCCLTSRAINHQVHFWWADCLIYYDNTRMLYNLNVAGPVRGKVINLGIYNKCIVIRSRRCHHHRGYPTIPLIPRLPKQNQISFKTKQTRNVAAHNDIDLEISIAPACCSFSSLRLVFVHRCIVFLRVFCQI